MPELDWQALGISIRAVILFSGCLALALVLTPWIERLARSRGWVDQPSDRKVHSRPIPRVGGIAIFMAFGLPVIANPTEPPLRVKLGKMNLA